MPWETGWARCGLEMEAQRPLSDVSHPTCDTCYTWIETSGIDGVCEIGAIAGYPAVLNSMVTCLTCKYCVEHRYRKNYIRCSRSRDLGLFSNTLGSAVGVWQKLQSTKVMEVPSSVLIIMGRRAQYGVQGVCVEDSR